jgi:oligopeptide transport system ATP-binding protein
MKEASSDRPLLSARDLCIDFNVRGRTLRAVRSVSLDLYAGETLAVVGESGSGKSVLTKSLVGMLDKNGRVASGEIWFGDQELTRLAGEKGWGQIRGKKIAMIFQDPMTALNPLKTIGAQVAEVIRLHRGADKKTARDLALDMLDRVGIPDPARRYKQYPHEFSGGMRQRVVIAVAVACEPKVLLCDEPTTALDVTIQAQILTLLKGLQKEMGMSMIFITHDLGVVARVADRVAVMYGGEIVEQGRTREIFYNARNPYTWALLSSMPQLGRKGQELFSIKGAPPNLYMTIKGDAFAPRNPYALKIDHEIPPPWFQVSPTHRAKTWLLDPRAPRMEPPAAITALHQRFEEGTP